MASTMVIREDSGGLKHLQSICRLCLSEESLEDLFQENGLQQSIMEFLLIDVSREDRLGHAICDVCRLRITEFLQFRTRCQEVQEVLQSMIRDENVGVEKELLSICSDEKWQELKLETCEEFGRAKEVEQREVGVMKNLYRPSRLQRLSDRTELAYDVINENDLERAENKQPIRIEDEICIEEVKLESLVNDDEFNNYNNQAIINDNIQVTQVWQCKTCNQQYQTKHQLSVHKKTTHGPKHHNCNVCLVSFLNRKDLKTHERTKQHLQNESADGYSRLNQTDYVKKDSKHKCSKCNRTFTRLCQLKIHERFHEPKTNEDKTIETEDDACRTRQGDSNFSGHLSTNTIPAKANESNNGGEWQCNLCVKSFGDKEKLRMHNRYHKSKNHECHICGKPFIFMFALKRHIPTHDANYKRCQTYDYANAAGPFRCDICQKQFKLRSTMRWHRTQVHGPKCHQCHMCDSRFSTRYGLRKHINCHYNTRYKANK